MPYDPNKHHRRSIRLQGYDYTRSGAYFVTIVTEGRDLLFDDPLLRRVVETMWQRIPVHAPHVSLDEWIVMPNHLHGILVIERPPSEDDSDLDERPVEKAGAAPNGPLPGSLGAVVGNFKAVTTRRINSLRKSPGTRVWQRNYYERIIRNERELDAIRQYITDNPPKWDLDQDNPANIGWTR